MTHMAFFKPRVDAFVTSLKTKDRRSVKEWEYVIFASMWADMALVLFSLPLTSDGTDDQLVKRLAHEHRALGAVRVCCA